LVYCLESKDLADDVDISQIIIPQDIVFEPKFDSELLQGVTVLKGKAEILKKEDWSKELYKAITPQKPEKIDIRLIPYFAWSNRGVNNMTVWMPLRY
jgi:DUF1680 family protein